MNLPVCIEFNGGTECKIYHLLNIIKRSMLIGLATIINLFYSQYSGSVMLNF